MTWCLGFFATTVCFGFAWLGLSCANDECVLEHTLNNHAQVLEGLPTEDDDPQIAYCTASMAALVQAHEEVHTDT
jgi:hypothetical protein